MACRRFVLSSWYVIHLRSNLTDTGSSKKRLSTPVKTKHGHTNKFSTILDLLKLICFFCTMVDH